MVFQSSSWLFFSGLIIVALIALYFLSTTILDFFGYRIFNSSMKKPDGVLLERSGKSGILYGFFLIVALSSSFVTFGWIHFLFSPLIILDLILVGRLISPNFGRGNSKILRVSLVVSGLSIYLFLGDGGDIGGVYYFYQMVNSERSSEVIVTSINLVFWLSLLVHLASISLSIFMIARNRQKTDA